MSRGSGGGGARAVALPAGVGQCDGKSCRWEGAPLAVGRAPRLRCRLQRLVRRSPGKASCKGAVGRCEGGEGVGAAALLVWVEEVEGKVAGGEGWRGRGGGGLDFDRWWQEHLHECIEEFSSGGVDFWEWRERNAFFTVSELMITV
uniref:Uncharacterized protein n=1 Tax=Oryza barthii TaxID=65489 RepID=A0A0D3FUA0_9ORYZ